MIYAIENDRYESYPVCYVESDQPQDMETLGREWTARYYLHPYPACPCFRSFYKAEGHSEAECDAARRADALRWSEYGDTWLTTNKQDIELYDAAPYQENAARAFAAWLVARHGFRLVEVGGINLALLAGEP